jgi:anti-sigma factor RsiW
MMIRGDQHLDDWTEIAVDYLDGQLDQDTRLAVEAHLSGCPACAARLRTQQYVVTVLQESVLADAPEDLEYRSIGELVFPSPGTEPLVRPIEEKKVYRTPRWFRTFRAWIPATVAVCALVAAVVGYGVARSNSGVNVASDSLRVATSIPAGAATTAGAAALGEASPVGAAQDITTTAAAATTTTALAGSVDSATKALNTFAATEDPGAMVRALENAQAPTYVAFRTAAPAIDNGGTGTETTVAATDTTAAPATTDTTAAGSGGGITPGMLTAEQAAALINEIKQFTGLDPVERTLWIAGPTFAVYLPRQDAAELVDLIRSMSSAFGLTVGLEGAPPSGAETVCAELLQHKGSFPVLEASRSLQPSTWNYDFTTSTLGGDSGDGSPPSAESLPDADGSHVVVIIWIAE